MPITKIVSRLFLFKLIQIVFIIKLLIVLLHSQ